jgi:hypothetical protein
MKKLFFLCAGLFIFNVAQASEDVFREICKKSAAKHFDAKKWNHINNLCISKTDRPELKGESLVYRVTITCLEEESNIPYEKCLTFAASFIKDKNLNDLNDECVKEKGKDFSGSCIKIAFIKRIVDTQKGSMNPQLTHPKPQVEKVAR